MKCFQACLLFDTCDSLETDDCDNCISGDSECPPAPCFIDDLRYSLCFEHNNFCILECFLLQLHWCRNRIDT